MNCETEHQELDKWEMEVGLPPISLLTDFGTADYFVGAVKGVILGLNPAARIVDITHEIPAQDVQAAAFTLLCSYAAFPRGTIHLAVVDPGVGSSRRPIVVTAGDQLFIGPDNGIFSYICEYNPDYQVFHLNQEKYFRHPVSPTFHGRDVFAPVAAALSLGERTEALGHEVDDLVRLKSIGANRFENGTLQARILHIDRFGNCVTNIRENNLTPEEIAEGTNLTVGKHIITSFRRFFAEGTDGEPFAVWGSCGFLEIVARNDSAAKVLGVERGEEVLLKRTSMAGR